MKPETQDPQIAMPSASRLGVVWPPSCAPRHANVAGDGMPAASPRRSTDARFFLVYFVIAAVAWSVFGQTLQHQFVNYDDQNYVYENREVSAGLTWHGFIAAFTNAAFNRTYSENRWLTATRGIGVHS